jgi:hypothetical protein
VQHWTTMGCYVCDPLYYQILTIAICEMQSKDVDSKMLMWNSLHAFINGWCNLTKIYWFLSCDNDDFIQTFVQQLRYRDYLMGRSKGHGLDNNELCLQSTS